MTIDDIRRLKVTAEETAVQIKERIKDKYDIACELVALSDSRGGKLVVGLNDKTGALNPLSYSEVQETTELLGNLASENVVPSILIETENIEANGGAVVVAHVKEGLNKPYRDNKGIVWVKNGADKRKVFDNAELAEMMTECGTLIPDLIPIAEVKIEDLDEDTVKLFLENRFSTVLQTNGMHPDKIKESSLDEICNTIAKGHDTSRMLRNLRLMRADGQLTVAAVLLFARHTQRWLPTMTAKCICFVGNSITGTQFRDKVNDSDMEGNILHQFNTIMAFFKRNLMNVQTSDEFNSPGQLEIPYVSLVEFTVNALVHRSLNWTAPIRVFIFDDRVEIHSPGILPNGLSVNDIMAGTSLPRNPFLFGNAIYLLPYTGVGSGIGRAMATGLDFQFFNNIKTNEFTISIPRQNNQTHNQLEEKSNQESKQESNQENTHKHLKLNKQQKDIQNFCSIPRTAKEILDRIGVSNQSKNRHRHITTLVEMGILEMTIPDKPKDRNQKYRRTNP